MSKLFKTKEGDQRLTKLLVGLIGFFLALNLFTLDHNHRWQQDHGGYLLQTECLLNGEPKVCKQDGEVRSQYSLVVGPDVYPWGYPLLIAPVYEIFGENYLALKLYNFVFFVGSLIIVYQLFARWLSQNQRLLLVLIYSSSFYFFWTKQLVESEITSLFFALLTIFAIQSQYLGSKAGYAKAVGIGLVMFMSVFIRVSNIVLLPTLWLWQILWRGKRFFSWQTLKLDLIPSVVFGTLYFLQVILLPASSYGNHVLFDFSYYVKYLIINVLALSQLYLLSLAELFGGILDARELGLIWGGHEPSMIAWSAVTIVAALATWLCAYVGVRRAMKREQVVYLLFIVFTLGLLVVYPFFLSFRGMLNVVPFILFFAVLGLPHIKFLKKWGVSSSELVYKFGSGLVCLSVLVTVVYSISDPHPYESGPNGQYAVEMYDFVASNFDERDIVAFHRPRLLQYKTGVMTVGLTAQAKLDEMPEITGYIEPARSDRWEVVAPELEKNGVEVFRNRDFVVFDLRPTSVMVDAREIGL